MSGPNTPISWFLCLLHFPTGCWLPSLGACQNHLGCLKCRFQVSRPRYWEFVFNSIQIVLNSSHDIPISRTPGIGQKVFWWKMDSCVFPWHPLLITGDSGSVTSWLCWMNPFFQSSHYWLRSRGESGALSLARCFKKSTGTAGGYEEESQWAEEQDLHQKGGAWIKLHYVAQIAMGLKQVCIVSVFGCCNPTVAGGLSPPPTPCKEPLSRVPSWPSLSPSFADPEHTSSLAAGMGEQRQLCWRRKIPPAPDCSNCLMFCICLHIPRQWQPPTQFLLESLSLSLIPTCSHIHTNTHGCVPSLAHSLPSIHKAKIATDTLTEEADWTASCSPPPLMTALKATQPRPHFLRRSSWEPACSRREMFEWAPAHPLYLSWLKELASWKLQGT